MSKSDPNTNAPGAILSAQQWQSLSATISDFNQHQLIWASGYLAGKADVGLSIADANISSAPQTAVSESVTVLYASQTGNSKSVAVNYADSLKSLGFEVSVSNVSDYNVRQLKKERILIIVASTHGEGEPPDDAMEFYEFIHSKKAPKLNELSFAVLGLGDTSYEFFCQTAKDFDVQLEKLGATRLLERVDCDVDYESEVTSWSEQVNEVLKSRLSQAPAAEVVTLPTATVGGSQYSKNNPFAGTFLESQKITGRFSSKDIRHIEISLEDSGLTYQPGDALGVWFENDAKLVDELLSVLSISTEATVTLDNENVSVRQALIEKFEITQSYPTFVERYADIIENDDLKQKLSDKSSLREYLKSSQIIDIVQAYPATVSANDFVSCLRKATPRLYSIASSQAEVEDEVHLTVGLVEAETQNGLRQGGASSYLAQRIEEGASVKVFVEENNNFRLPSSGDTPVIMIGPGTGIAPFRGFMQQRDVDASNGDNWLFFGNPNYTEDFLYQVEWQRYVKSGLLDKVTLAFSRDQEHKIYVQDRIRENGKTFCEWLERGAHVYVCGDAERMAKDVHAAMKDAISEHLNKSQEEAETYLTDLRKAKRYQKDVY